MKLLSKMIIYQSLRAQGTRLYSVKSWSQATALNVSKKKTSINEIQQETSVAHSSPVSAMREDVGRFAKLKEWLGFQGALRYKQGVLQNAGFRLYISAAEAVLYNDIFHSLQLEDNFMSWNRLAVLHLWMIMVRLQLEDREGEIVRNSMIMTYHNDVQAKSKKIGKAMKVTIKKKNFELLYSELLAARINYDEGLLGSDKEMAGALWRQFFNMNNDVNPEHLETMVQYIRKQVQFLESISSEDMLCKGLIPFLPLYGDTIPQKTYSCLEEARTNILAQNHLKWGWKD